MDLGKTDLETLDEMHTLLNESSKLYRPSPFWTTLGEAGKKQLHEDGFSNFKRTINMRYFNWNLIGILAHQFTAIAFWYLINCRRLIRNSTFANYGPNFNFATAYLYKIYVCMLWEYCGYADSRGLTRQSIEEPPLGSPLSITYHGKAISQDLCNSIHEFYRSTYGHFAEGTEPSEIAELGAGYGRLGFVFLRALPRCNYTIIDIPPALFVAQKYIKEIFPNEKVFCFRRFQSFDDIKNEFCESRIRFLLSSQIAMLPDSYFDLFVNVSSLHEMTADQIKNYLEQIDRTTRGTFYSKQWRKSRAHENRFYIRENEYPVPKHWQTIYHRRHPIQRMFFEALYRTRVAGRIVA